MVKMAFNMKEVASLRGDDKKYEENFSKIDWSNYDRKQRYECKWCNWQYLDEDMKDGVCIDCRTGESNESQN